MTYQKPAILMHGSSKKFIEAGPGVNPDQGVPAPGAGWWGNPTPAVPVVAVVVAAAAVVLKIFAFSW